ncbi:cytochrome c [Pelagicoccus sp. SDUM812003]|uniref:c-type cytochrome n=1 Tax=Pelagicoccus sp. SDUM812003 TaxID=3041267 RepID=UPI00280E4C67|nr:cytochrome c [Pelagicoccus sp. SDUM812003]MDQ8205059.1 cytochrome c [Pelagicoccus sp. SDUM812003]
MKRTPYFMLSLAAMIGSSLVADEFDVVAAWEKDCQKCHAEDGSGLTKKGRKLRLKDYRDPEVQAKMSDEEIVKAINEGVKEDGEFTMNAYGEDYTEEEINAFLAYVRSLAK